MRALAVLGCALLGLAFWGFLGWFSAEARETERLIVEPSAACFSFLGTGGEVDRSTGLLCADPKKAGEAGTSLSWRHSESGLLIYRRELWRDNEGALLQKLAGKKTKLFLLGLRQREEPLRLSSLILVQERGSALRRFFSEPLSFLENYRYFGGGIGPELYRVAFPASLEIQNYRIEAEVLYLSLSSANSQLREVELRFGDAQELGESLHRLKYDVAGWDSGLVQLDAAPKKETLHRIADLLRARIGAKWFLAMEKWLWKLRDIWPSLSPASPSSEAARDWEDAVDDAPQRLKSAAWPPAAITRLDEKGRAKERLSFQELPLEGKQAERAQNHPAAAQGSPIQMISFYPDEERPQSRLTLFAFDLRRLILDVQAGYEEPNSAKPGLAHVPVGESAQVVATFNGGFKAEHGSYGMKVRGTEVSEAKAGAATIAFTRSGSVYFGAWPDHDSEKIAEAMWSYRQNLDPLIASGVINPKQRGEWGEQLLGASMYTERSALCLREDGDILYAWGEHLSGDGLARGLKSVGCIEAIHLDMNPRHAGLNLVDLSEEGDPKARNALEEMKMVPYRLATWSPKDFFYLRWRGDEIPLNWKESRFGSYLLEAIHEHDGQLFSYQSFDPSRSEAQLLGGLQEPIRGGRSPETEWRGLAPIAGSWLLGVAKAGKNTGGLGFAKAPSFPLQDELSTLVIDGNGRWRLAEPRGFESPTGNERYIQFPALLSHGELNEAEGARPSQCALAVHLERVIIVCSEDVVPARQLAASLKSFNIAEAVNLRRGKRALKMSAEERSSESAVDRFQTRISFSVEAHRASAWKGFNNLGQNK